MTKEQYEKYKKLDNELKDIRDFCFWCDKKNKKYDVCKRYFMLLVKRKKIFFYKLRYLSTDELNTYYIPLDLQDRIIDVVESYLDEKEEELRNI